MEKEKVYGRRGKPTPLSNEYDQTTELVLTRQTNEPSPIAWGKWTSRGFLLKYGSLIMENDNYEQNKPGIKAIKNKLIENGLISECDGDSCMLQDDIYFHSPSAAGELVNGHSCNGLKDWKNLDGVSLGDLLYK